jgi:hypothetical protein
VARRWRLTALEQHGHGDGRGDEALQVGDRGGGRGVGHRDAVVVVTTVDLEDHRVAVPPGHDGVDGHHLAD